MAGIDVPPETVRAIRPIAFHLPAIPDIEAYVDDVRTILSSGRLSSGPYVDRLERLLSPWLGDRSVVAVSNASDGLIAALSVLARPGCEVIIPGFTYLATWQAVLWAGMVPVVADVDDNALLDPSAVEAALTPRTGAILAVHLTGAHAPTEALRVLADRQGAALVTDAAHALGSAAPARNADWLGDAGVTSIGATKQVAAGEGGAIAVRDPATVQAFRHWARQGHEPGEMDATSNGMNLRLSELTAALALHQLDGLAAQVERRRAIHARYAAAFAGLPIRLSGEPGGERSSFKDQLVWVDDPADRGPLRAALATAAIETRPYYAVAVPDLTAFRGIVASAARSRDLAARSFALPIHARLTDDDVDRIIETICAFFGA